MLAIPQYGGLGTVPITQTIGSSVTTGLTTAAMVTGGPTNPVGLALTIAAGGAALVTGLLGAFGVGVPDLHKIQATHVVDALEPYLQQNLSWWQNASTPHTVANQQQGIATFAAVWQQVESGCSDPSLGSAGVNCIRDRQQGGKWDWFRMYLDPIVNSQIIDANSTTATVSNVSASLGLGQSGPLILGVLAIGIGLAMASD